MHRHYKFICYLILILSLGLAPSVKSDSSCLTCHQNSVQDWRLSDHAKSMMEANKENILGDFNNKKVSHFGQQAFFFIEKNLYKVTVSYDGNEMTLPIKFTFGHYPLQQYLVETTQGRLQVLPFAWDARSKKENGQRWYHNYADEEIKPNDRLHWLQPLQNWNGMCADCHSDGLTRNYTLQSNEFDTHWQGLNVGCVSCHGKMKDHNKIMMPRHSTTGVDQDTQVIKPKNSLPQGRWHRDKLDKTVQWQGKPRDNSFMQQCFACHSLRAPLTDGFSANKKYLDQFSPQLVTTPNYHVDGQIKDEVYVYGSFLQSKMYSKGVNCIDCHDKHTMKVKSETNNLCTQCHAPTYDTKSHHQHNKNSTGALCVNCHMPTNRYMGVDDRRDHSFKIPRPDLSIEFKTPNACVQCHKTLPNKLIPETIDNQWAKETLLQWHGNADKLSTTQRNYYLLQSGKPISLRHHIEIVEDKQLSAIVRATALQMLIYTTDRINELQIKNYLTSKHDLIRLAAAEVSILLPIKKRIAFLKPLLIDPLKAIRVAAARAVVDAHVSLKNLPVFMAAFQELKVANEINSWRGEGLLNKANTELRAGQVQQAELSLLSVVKIEPYFDAGYINLADYYRVKKSPQKVESILKQAMDKIPKSAALRYSYGLHLVRQQQHDQSVRYFKEAMSFNAQTEAYAYAYVLSLDGQGKSDMALQILKKIISNYSNVQSLKSLGLYLSKKVQNKEMYYWFSAQ